MKDDFKFVIPAEISKGEDGEWRVAGLASSASVDRQGEVIIPEGIDATPIAKGKGFFNWDHDNSPENTVGVLDSYKKGSGGLYVEGRLFKNHSRAKAIREIMTSLNKGDKGRVGMSVEGKVIERDSKNPSIIRRCLIKNVALTMNPVNQDTFADIVKSMSEAESTVEFESPGVPEILEEVKPIEKALSITSGNAAAPADRTGGDALGQEELETKKKKSKLVKKSSDLFKSSMIEMLDKLQVLYPDHSRSEIWEAVRDRLETRFPQLKKEEL